MDPAPPPNVAGLSLPGGEFRISRRENAELCAAVGVAPAPDGSAHPIYFYIASQIGMGVTVDGLLALCDFKAKDGPLLASSKVEFDAPLITEAAYRVDGHIVSLTRKPSRSFGAVDVLIYELALSDSQGHRALVTTNTWMLPRRTSA